MSRIANYASQQILNSYLAKVQQRIQTGQVQLTSEKKAQDYMGIGADTQRLVGYEVNIQLLQNYIKGNQSQDIFLKSTTTALEGIEKTIKDFKTTLSSFNTTEPKDENAVRTIQEQAFRSMLSLQSYLNTEVNGRFLFAGNRANVAPVNLGLSSLAAFQERFDGSATTYPTTRDQHIENFNLNKDGNGRVNWLTFTQDADGNAATAGTSTITSTTAQFSNVTVGSVIEVTGTQNNNGIYKVKAVSGGGTVIEINTVMLTDEAATSAPTLTKTNGTALTSTNFGTVTFDRSAGTITAATAGSLSSLTVGSSFTVAGSAQNNGTYYVESNTGTTLTIRESKLTDEGTGAATVLTLSGQSFTFTNAPETIDSGVAGTFSSLSAGMKITIGGTTSNNATYTIASVAAGGQSITVYEPVTAELPVGANDTATVTVATPTLDLVAQSFTFTNNATSDDTISAAAGKFSSLSVGMKITIGGTASNNGTYTITSISSDGSSISVQESLATEAAGGNETALVANADGTVKSTNYYQGDTFTRVHRVSENREFTMDLNGIDPAFEKALRAMGTIAQGVYGTAGGLDNTANAQRLTNALNLLDLSLKYNNAANPQYEAGKTNSIEATFVTLGYQRNLIQTANETHTRLSGFFETRTAELENIDKLDVITRLLDDQKALEASYQAMSRIRSLNLHDFLPVG